MANDPVPGTDAALLTDLKTQLAAGITATIDESTLATSAKQDTQITKLAGGLPTALVADRMKADPTAPGTLTNRSGTITVGGTAQQLAAVNAARRYLFIQNADTAEDLWFNFTTAAIVGQPSIKLGPGQSYENPAHFCSTEAVSVIAATTAHAFVAKEG